MVPQTWTRFPRDPPSGDLLALIGHCVARLADPPAEWREHLLGTHCVCAPSHSVMPDPLQIPWTVAHRAPLSMGFSKQEYWSGLPFPTPGDLPNPGIELYLLQWQADSFTTESSGSPTHCEPSTK